MVNVQKSLMGASSEADFWHGENIDNAEKKSSKYCFWLFFSIFTNIAFGYFSQFLQKEFQQNSMKVKFSFKMLE